jgi:glutamate-1-semialdehyde 2,1-aminomutase
LVSRRLNDFIPPRIYDIHAHLLSPAKELPPYLRDQRLGLKEYAATFAPWLPERTLNGLFFGFPAANNDRAAINQWLAKELLSDGEQNLNRALLLVSPHDDQRQMARLLAGAPFAGLKPYHCYARPGDTTQAQIEEFAPEWMWEACAERQGVLMLHIMRDRACADQDNVAALRRLCRRYPRCQVILAHLARSFSYRTARQGLAQLCDVENLWLDTSAVTESETFHRAIETFGPKRILFGTDYPISQLRGRCVATGGALRGHGRRRFLVVLCPGFGRDAQGRRA